MLTPLCLDGLDLTQRTVSGEEVDRLCRAENISWKCKARNQDDSWELVLYVRFNVKRFEAGLVSWPGPNCQDDHRFPKLMVRVFGKDHELCLDAVAKHYGELIKEHKLYQVER